MLNNIIKVDFFYKSLCFFAALVFALVLANLPVDQFVDRENYLVYAMNAPEILSSRIGNGYFSFVFNEPVWVLINLILSSVMTAENCVRVIILFSAFSTSYLVLKNSPPEYILVVLAFIFLPQILKNNIIHLRQGLGVAFFLWGWFSERKMISYLFFFTAALVHSSFIIILFGMVVITLLSGLKISDGIRGLIYISVGIGISLFGLMIASYLGARQAEQYSEITASTSGFGFLFWSGILLIYILEGKSFIKENSFSIFFIFIYLATYFTLPVTGRVLESALLIILLTSLKLRNWAKASFFFIYFIYKFV